MSVCYIVGAGDCDSLPIIKIKNDLIIAADGGLNHLNEFGIKPDIVIGDFDSFGAVPDGDNVIRLKPEKDVTDLFAAVEAGLEKGCDRFEIYGATGGRLDHTLANIQLAVSLAEKGISHVVRGVGFSFCAIKNSKLSFPSDKQGYVSVFAHSDNCFGVTINGLKYELDNASLSNSFALGVSNEFVGKESEISVENGTLIIIYGYKK
ncbi:MAG: thiamine diphosphokinase, partial [Clostridia bacterium]|nr:thiamine diphosphokinase [Clostridia bacterium]